VRRMEGGVEHLSMQNASLVVALAICLLLSWLAVKIGMAAIIGAFFAGLVFADYAPQWNLFPRVAGITEFLAPFFFFAIGARLNLTLINRQIIVATAIVSVLAILSKVLGCGAPMIGQGWRAVLQVGIGMMPRGEVAHRCAGRAAVRHRYPIHLCDRGLDDRNYNRDCAALAALLVPPGDQAHSRRQSCCARPVIISHLNKKDLYAIRRFAAPKSLTPLNREVCLGLRKDHKEKP